MESNFEPQYVPWQNCPKCLGQGVVAQAPNTPFGTSPITTSSTRICDVCNGAKIIPMSKKIYKSEFYNPTS